MKPIVRTNFVTAGIEDVPPTLSVHAQEFGPALAQALQDAHVRPPEASFVEGELAGTKSHLEDLRMLLGLKKKG